MPPKKFKIICFFKNYFSYMVYLMCNKRKVGGEYHEKISSYSRIYAR